MSGRPGARGWPAVLVAALLLGACGGGSGNSGAPGSSPAPVANQVATVVDAGPPGVKAINILYTSVTLCAPGSASACQPIDYVQVDTGSSGFRVLASALGNGLAVAQLPLTTDATGNAIVECTQFVDGWSWGPVRSADLHLAGEVARDLPIQVIGDPAYANPLIPSSCSNVPGGKVEDTVLQFGANGILGIGSYVQDCGPLCASGAQNGSHYNACTLRACSPAAVALAAQVSNPVAFFAADRNGVMLTLTAEPDAGAPRATGMLTFGIGTQADNALGSATVYQLDPSFGTLITHYNGALLNSSFLDSGSNALFFPDATLATCPGQVFFYCPANPVSRTGVIIQGLNGATATLGFTIDSAASFAASVTAAPTLAGPVGSAALQSFDWGLPFFYGRPVFVVFETATVGGVAGPAVAF